MPAADEELNASYDKVDSVISIGRGIGVWGDMVVSLKDGSKIEMRGLPKCVPPRRRPAAAAGSSRSDAAV